MNNETRQNNDINPNYRPFIWTVTIIFMLCVFYGICMYLLFDVHSRGTFGDMFGALNALFAGLAFAGVIYAIILQKNELALQREELKMTREELMRSASAQEDSSKAFAVQVEVMQKQANSMDDQAYALEESARISSKTLKEMQAQREQVVRAYPVAYFEVIPQKDLIYLIVTNIGQSLARDVEIKFDPDLVGGYSNRVSRIFSKTIPYFPPSYEIRTIFSKFSDYMGKLPDNPLQYTVSIKYYSALDSTKSVAKYTLDLEPYSNVVFTHEPGTEELIENIKKLNKNIEVIIEKLVNPESKPQNMVDN